MSKISWDEILLSRVHVYRNVNKGCWSVRKNGRVVRHVDEITLIRTRFHVQPAGRRRFQQTGVKNVHAYVSGFSIDCERFFSFKKKIKPTSEWRRIVYHPSSQDWDGFVIFPPSYLGKAWNKPITEPAGSAMIHFDKRGKVWLIGGV